MGRPKNTPLESLKAEGKKRRYDRKWRIDNPLKAKKIIERANTKYHTNRSGILEVMRETHKQRHRKHKQLAVNSLGGCCSICGHEFPLCCYDFHHKNPKEKECEIRFSGSNTRILKELNKCILVCANCHRIIHYSLKT